MMAAVEGAAELAANEPDGRSLISSLLTGEYGLARCCWVLYLLGAGLFFGFGSRAVNSGDWHSYLTMAVALLVHTLVLIIGIRVAYRGPQRWQVLSRTSSIFMVTNVLVAISTLGFVF